MFYGYTRFPTKNPDRPPKRGRTAALRIELPPQATVSSECPGVHVAQIARGGPRGMKCARHRRGDILRRYPTADNLVAFEHANAMGKCCQAKSSSWRPFLT